MSERIQFSDALPDAFKRLVNLHEYVVRIATEEGLDPTLIDMLKTRASQINGCAFCTDMHSAEASAHGETQRRLLALPVWWDTNLFSEQERAALALTEAMTTLPGTHGVPDDVYDRAAKVFTERQLAVVVWAASVINTFNRLGVTSRKPLPQAGR
ncbi:MAG: carboxymuconolactone decarboxylase family protein [Sciscionella sp.]